MPVNQTVQNLGPGSLASSVLTANATTVATSSATATVMMTLGPLETYGAGYVLELFAAAVTRGTTNVSLEWWLDGVFNQSIVALLVNAVSPNPVTFRNLIALAPGVHTLTVRGFVDAGTGTIVAGTGVTGAQPNAVALLRPF